MKKLFIYGAGGHASVVADVVRCGGEYEILGLIDDNPALKGGRRFGLPVVGREEALAQRETEDIFLGIGDNHARFRVSAALAGWRFPVLVHPTAVIGSSVSLGEGTVVMPGAVIEYGASIGAHCIINNGAIVGHESRVEAFCHVSGNSAMGGATRLGRFGFIGLGAVVTPGVTLGDNCLLAAGSMASKNVEEGATIVGNPGRPFFNRRGE